MVVKFEVPLNGGEDFLRGPRNRNRQLKIHLTERRFQNFIAALKCTDTLHQFSTKFKKKIKKGRAEGTVHRRRNFESQRQ
jgi:hypothetical protein